MKCGTKKPKMQSGGLINRGPLKTAMQRGSTAGGKFGQMLDADNRRRAVRGAPKMAEGGAVDKEVKARHYISNRDRKDMIGANNRSIKERASRPPRNDFERQMNEVDDANASAAIRRDKKVIASGMAKGGIVKKKC